ncbi:FliH/SctL family protein [Rubrivivax gelatinosus]|nr:FliH/SctL family protein [Rubrivivax gelatinosus]
MRPADLPAIHARPATASARDEAAPAHFFAVHVDPALSLATDTLLLPPQQAAAFDDALALAAALAALHAEEQARIAAAVAAGRAAGFEQGRCEAEAAVHEAAAQQLAARVQALVQRHDDELAALSRQVVELALLVLRRVAAELPAEELMAAVAQRLLAPLQEAGADGGHLLRLHPALVEPVRARLQARGLHLACRADENLAPLDCVLDTPGGRLLAGLETQLQRVQAALQQRLPA